MLKLCCALFLSGFRYDECNPGRVSKEQKAVPGEKQAHKIPFPEFNFMPPPMCVLLLSQCFVFTVLINNIHGVSLTGRSRSGD